MKKGYSKSKWSRSRQRAELLVANPDFQQEVKQIRERFKIPLDGIKTNEESEKWHHKFYESDDIYFEANRKKIIEEIKKLEQEKKFQEGFNLKRKFNKEAPINAFHVSIKTILKNHKLPLVWEHSVQRYILFNSIDLMWLPGNISIREDFDQDTGLKRLSIEIDDSTTLEDIKKAWPSIKFHQKRLHSYKKEKFQPIKKFDRDKEAYELRQSGRTYKQIAETLSLKYKTIYSWDDVASFIKRHKQKTGIN